MKLNRRNVIGCLLIILGVTILVLFGGNLVYAFIAFIIVILGAVYGYCIRRKGKNETLMHENKTSLDRNGN